MQNNKIIITGATGWFGKSAIYEYWKLFGLDALINNISAFSSSSKNLSFDEFNYTIKTRPLEELENEKNPAAVIHTAFLTQDKIYKIGIQEYIKTNERIINLVSNFLRKNKNCPVIYISSGAASKINNLENSKIENDPYAYLKKKEENKLKELVFNRMILILRVYAATGKFIKIPSKFAFANFLQQGISQKKIKLESNQKVIRSYVNVSCLFELAWKIISYPLENGFYKIDACYEKTDLLSLVFLISKVLKIDKPIYKINNKLAPNIYSGEIEKFKKLLKKYNIEHPSMKEQIIETFFAIKNNTEDLGKVP